MFVAGVAAAGDEVWQARLVACGCLGFSAQASKTRALCAVGVGVAGATVEVGTPLRKTVSHFLIGVLVSLVAGLRPLSLVVRPRLPSTPTAAANKTRVQCVEAAGVAGATVEVGTPLRKAAPVFLIGVLVSLVTGLRPPNTFTVPEHKPGVQCTAGAGVAGATVEVGTPLRKAAPVFLIGVLVSLVAGVQPLSLEGRPEAATHLQPRQSAILEVLAKSHGQGYRPANTVRLVLLDYE